MVIGCSEHQPDFGVKGQCHFYLKSAKTVIRLVMRSLNVYSSIVIILMGKRELVALLNLSSWCLVMVERLFLVVPWGCLWFVNVLFPDHTHLLFLVAYGV